MDGDKSLVLAQKKLIQIAERCSQNVFPLYYPMSKAKAELLTPQSLYDGLVLAFKGGRIGGISNEITKIWNSEDITDEAKMAVKWLCMETNFTIDYAKTLFKPQRPDYADKILKKYAKNKVPYFFQYAKKKDEEQVMPINGSTVNKIVKEIKDDKRKLKGFRHLNNVDYLMLLSNKDDSYCNLELNKAFNRWNKKYGNNLFVDSEDFDKTNVGMICSQVLDDLHSIEKDDDKIINSLVRMLYKTKTTRKKKLLWCLYGEQLYENLCNNVIPQNICHVCGKRTDEDLVGGKCLECRKREIKNLGGKKVIQCVDCGVDVIVASKDTRTCRCDDCQQKKILSDKRAFYHRHKNLDKPKGLGF